MERKEFLSLVGASASSMLFGCLAGCSKSQGYSPGPPANVDFTLDLTQPSNAALQTNGDCIYNNGILIAHTLSGQFIAVYQICTHQNYTINYIAQNHVFYCSAHGGTYSENGQVVGGPPPAPLTSYTTFLNGNNLRIYS